MIVFCKSNQRKQGSSKIQKKVIQGQDQTWKTDINNKEHLVTKIIHTK